MESAANVDDLSVPTSRQKRNILEKFRTKELSKLLKLGVPAPNRIGDLPLLKALLVPLISSILGFHGDKATRKWREANREWERRTELTPPRKSLCLAFPSGTGELRRGQSVTRAGEVLSLPELV